MRVVKHLNRFSSNHGQCPIPGNVQGSEQPDLVDVTARCRGAGLGDL